MIFNQRVGSTLFINARWVFLSIARDDLNGIQTALSYYVTTSSYTLNPTIATKNKIGAQRLSPATMISWGGKDRHYVFCDCRMQYVRFYVNYAPRTTEQMIGIALMNPQSR